MKVYILMALAVFLTTIIFRTAPVTKNNLGAISPQAATARERYLENIDHFYESLNLLETNIRSSTSVEMLHQNFFDCRKHYKKIEFLSEYFDPAFMKSFNGANLQRLDDNILSTDVIEPQGLQVIEELLFDELPLNHKEELLALLKELKSTTQLLKQNTSHKTFSDRIIFEACRAEVVRIMTLGITGYDSPVLKRSLPEAEVALEAVYVTLQPYFISIRKGSPVTIDRLEEKFRQAISYLRTKKDFDSFDRLYFIKELGNPIYTLILEAHKASGIETMKEVYSFTSSVNYDASSIFDKNFLNPYFYNRARIDSENKKSVALGKLLFYDPLFSLNNKRACASCHDPQKGFSDGLPKSIAFDFDGDVGRNSPGLVNAIFQSAFFYDMRAKYPEEQIDHVVYNHKEFNTDFETIIRKLKSSPGYVTLFKEAFPAIPGEAIDGYTINKALADFVRSLTAFNSPFDKYIRGEQKDISPEVKRGFNLFMGKAQCGTCHFAPVFNGTVPPNYMETEAEVLGVPSSAETKHPVLDEDPGRFRIRSSPLYRNMFKTPTVRNIALTAPYMHNGVYKSLEEVLDFYNKGGGVGLSLDVPNQTLPSEPLRLNSQEIKDIISFMRSLTDTTELTSRPVSLPSFPLESTLNSRKVGGEY